MTQFSVSSTPYLECVAVSQTSDAAGAYNRYAFVQPNFNDYPKLGVWPDGYYISFNMFNGNVFVGGQGGDRRLGNGVSNPGIVLAGSEYVPIFPLNARKRACGGPPNALTMALCACLVSLQPASGRLQVPHL